jgi:hypothetical protein
MMRLTLTQLGTRIATALERLEAEYAGPEKLRTIYASFI